MLSAPEPSTAGVLTPAQGLVPADAEIGSNSAKHKRNEETLIITNSKQLPGPIGADHRILYRFFDAYALKSFLFAD